jgi:hypothetical protein
MKPYCSKIRSASGEWMKSSQPWLHPDAERPSLPRRHRSRSHYQRRDRNMGRMAVLFLKLGFGLPGYSGLDAPLHDQIGVCR